MPIIWRYLIRNYLRVFSLSLTAFIAVLLVTRFQSIARFAATGATIPNIGKFIFLQIPFILPLSIPISCLIASLLLFQNMSRNHELTAIRVAGMGIFPLVFPLLIVGLFLSLSNFSLISDLSPKCRVQAKKLAMEMTLQNPLSLLQKHASFDINNTYFGVNYLSKGDYAEDVFFVLKNPSSKRLNLSVLKKITLNDHTLLGEDVALISSMDPKSKDTFDHLIIENQKQVDAPANQLSQFFHTTDLRLGPEHLGLRMLIAKCLIENNGFIPKGIYYELARRLSLTLAPLVFTIVGIVYGIQLKRRFQTSKIFWAVGWMVFFLTSFVAAKSLKHNWIGSVLLYLLPHAIILFFCFKQFQKEQVGV